MSTRIQLRASTVSSFTAPSAYSYLRRSSIYWSRQLSPTTVKVNAKGLNIRSFLNVDPTHSKALSHDARIGSQQLRLLQIINQAGTIDGQQPALKCNTQVFSLHDLPPFRALSYTWGPPYTFDRRYTDVQDQVASRDTSVQVEISCDDRFIKVGSNIHNALLHLRENVLKPGEWIWVDTICINQLDAEEKTDQVAIMSHIYTKAYEVLVWLGPVPNGFEKDLADMAALINNFLDRLTHLAVEDHLQIPSSGELQTLVPYDVSFAHDANIARVVGMSNLSERFAYFSYFVMNCRWFDRVWTMQELVLNLKPRMMCGQHEFSWDKLSSLVTFMESVDLISTLHTMIESLNGAPLTKQSLRGLQRMRTICHIRDRNLDDHHFHIEHEASHPSMRSELYMDGIYLTLLLRHAWDARCTDNRDHVAGILGMANSWYDQRLVDAIGVNYSHGVSEILVNTTKAILQNSQSLDVLTILPFTTRGKEDVPSWVFQPNEPQSHRGPNLLPYNYTASASMRHSSYGFTIEGLELHCLGFRFDTISDVANYDPLESNDDLAQECLRLGARLSDLVNKRDRAQHIWRTLLMVDDEQAYPRRKYEPQFWRFVANSFAQNAYIKSMHNKVGANKYLKDMSALLDNFCNGLANECNATKVMEDARRIFGTLCKTNDKRTSSIVEEEDAIDAEISFAEVTSRCFVLGRGLLGLGPSQVRCGDEVWILASGSVPFVLRPSNKANVYTFVGHCFVSGHMYGEMLDASYGYKGAVSISSIKVF